MSADADQDAPPAPRRADMGYRTYDIYQRERVGESTAKINQRQLLSPAFLRDPYPLLEILRENYPCYRNWLGNSFWITRYDDVTSVFVDDANYETRPKAWFCGLSGYGRDLREEPAVVATRARRIDETAAEVAQQIVAGFASDGNADLALDFAARYPMELLARILDLPGDDVPRFAELYWRLQRAAGWEPTAAPAGLEAAKQLTEYFRPLVTQRRAKPGDDLVSTIVTLQLPHGPATAEDIVITLLEEDHETLHGALANMWFLLLTHPKQLHEVLEQRRLVKFAYLETLRHSTPVLSALRFARHEVERFGRLLPAGALVVCSAAAANRDPRVFSDPEEFQVGRKDLCQREPRGMYRADGLPSGIAFGLGKPSKQPAVPEDRPRSLYAITRDVAVSASNVLLDALHDLRLAPGGRPQLLSLRLGEMHTCWTLPVIFGSHST